MNASHLMVASVLLSLPFSVLAQDKYGTRDGVITFSSQTPLEDIIGVNSNVASVLVLSTGEIQFSALVKAFEFEKALLEEHFNEDYMESSKFPKAIFKGHLVPKEGDDLSKVGIHEVGVVGILTIHGIDKPLSTHATLETDKEGNISAKSTFELHPEDFGIEIPGVVRDKIAKTINVKVEISYSKL